MTTPNLPQEKLPFTVTVRDETVTGTKTQERSLSFHTEHITVRDLIRERVRQEVQEYNTAPPGYFRGLVQPTDAETTLNGYKLRTNKRLIDWEAQYTKAIQAFEGNGFFLLVDDRQAESLDETLLITPKTEVSFIKLVPLVGG